MDTSSNNFLNGLSVTQRDIFLFLFLVKDLDKLVLAGSILLDSGEAQVDLLLRLEADNATTPVALGIVELLVEGRADRLSKLGELKLVLLLDTSEDHCSGGLLVDQLAQASLALHNAERNVLLAAESGEPDNEL